MRINEINKRLKQGEKLECSNCDFFYNESGTCLIIMCENPFLGPMPEELEGRLFKLINYYKKFKNTPNN